tara:strand:- start:33 stop:545 length:513 start_codon:yes stop_codon:yes gene_type:complete
MSQPNLIEAVHTLRSYNIALTGMAHDPQSISSWTTRYAENDGKSPNFCQDAAIGLLCHLGNPIYAYNNINNNQQSWSGIFGSAEQALNEEANWQGAQTYQHNLTSYDRVFSTDIQWIQQYAQSLQYSMDIPFEYFVNKVIADLRQCQGSSGAGSISHSPMTHPSMQQPVP